MIYIQSMTPTETVLVAKVAVWRALLALRPVPRRSSISMRVAATISTAIGDRDDDEVVRVRLPAENAAAVVEMARIG